MSISVEEISTVALTLSASDDAQCVFQLIPISAFQTHRASTAIFFFFFFSNKDALTTIFIKKKKKKKGHAENFVQVQIGILGGDRGGSQEG